MLELGLSEGLQDVLCSHQLLSCTARQCYKPQHLPATYKALVTDHAGPAWVILGPVTSVCLMVQPMLCSFQHVCWPW